VSIKDLRMKDLPNLKECREKVGQLVKSKGHGNSSLFIPIKILFSILELSEAGDKWKKGASKEEIAEELIDAIFYILDCWRLLCPELDPDKVFLKKLRKNLSRKRQYGWEGVKKWLEEIERKSLQNS